MSNYGKFSVLTLEEFGAYLKARQFNRVIRLIQNHHTAVPGYAQFKGDNHVAMMQAMEDYHIHHAGMSAIAQNLTTFPDGKIGIGRDIDTVPAGIKGANANGICIEHVGNFDLGGDHMSEAHRATIIGVNALLCRRFNLQPSTDSIVYHHWFELNTGERRNGAGVVKTCPGTGFFGGNTVEACAKNFVPSVDYEMGGIPAPKVEPKQMRVTAASGLNVRSAPAFNASIVASLQPGQTVDVHEERDGWARIHPANQMWVNLGYLKAV